MYQQSFDSRLCGQGKTTDTHTAINASTYRHLVVSPTKLLNAEQSVGLLDSLRLDTDSTSSYQTVTAELASALYEDTTRTICTTHASLMNNLKAAYGKPADSYSGIHLIIDEALEGAIKEAAIMMSRDASPLLLSKLDLKPWAQNSTIFEVTAKDGAGLEELAAGSSHCEILKASPQLKALAQRVVDPLYLTLIPKDAYETFHSKLAENGNASFAAISLLRPDLFEKFKSVRTLSAFFLQTEYALAMAYQGVQFANITPPAQDTYSNSHRLHIHYFTDKLWTRTLRQRKDADDKTNMEKVVEFIRETMGSNEFIFNANTDDRECFDALPNAELVTETHGRNDLRHITKAAFLGSRNVSPFEGKILSQLDIL